MKYMSTLVILMVAVLGFGFSQTQVTPVEAQTNMIVNGNFNNGVQNWQFWDAISYRVTGGVFEFYRTTGGVSAVVLQKTGQNLASGAKLKATFQLGNTDCCNYNKRITVIAHPDDWSDLQACTFMLDDGQALGTYEMEFFTNKAWTNATLSFYSSMDNNRGWIRLDNVTLQQDSTLPTNRVRCTDPNRPPTGLGSDSANYISNGNFSNGTTDWGLSGEIVSRVQSGVFEYYTVVGGPAAVILQNFDDNPSTDPIATGNQAEARFRLGNSSAVRKRISVIIHNTNFTNLSFCTFWLPPNTPLNQYVVRFGNNGFGTWLQYISFYVSPFDSIGWARLDDVVVRRRPGLTIVGTECHYPGSLPSGDGEVFGENSFTMPTLLPTATGMPSFGSLLPETAAQPFVPAPEFNGGSSAEGSIGE